MRDTAAGRLDPLDAMRGLAALAVLVSHVLDFGPSLEAPTLAWLLRFTPLRVLGNGRAPVVFFFVLSGYVLTLSLLRPGAPGPVGFALRRGVRLLPPVAAVLALSAALREVFWAGGPPPGVGWLPAGQLWHPDWTWSELALRSLLIGAAGDFSLDPPLWSLVHEWRASLALPLVLLMVRGRVATLLAAALLLMAAAIAAGAPLDHALLGPRLHSTLAASAYFALPFAAGAALAMAGRDWRLEGEPRHAAWVAVVACAGLGSDLASVGGSVLLILLARGPGAMPRLLSAPAPVLLGRISFSLYLVHVPVMAAAVHGTAGLVPVWAGVGLGALASLPAAAAFYALVEAPTQRLSRRFGRCSVPGRGGAG
jgi:peptidoglycan/LPS O-acetylase OafA/YrhL